MASKERPRILVYYPFFPVYRRAILGALARSSEATVEFAAGTRGRAGIHSLTGAELPQLNELKTKTFFGFTWNSSVVKLMIRGRYDAVVIAPATMSLSVWCSLVAGRVFRIPVFLWGQCGKPGAKGLKRSVQELINRLAFGLLVYGESERRGATQYGLSENKVSIVRNAVADISADRPINADDLASMARSKGIGCVVPPSYMQLTYIGRVEPRKNVESFVSAIAILQSDGYNVSGQIVGDGASMPAVQDLINQSGVQVATLGSVYDASEIARIFEKTALVVVPYEIGLQALDAISHATPVLYADNPSCNGPEVEALTLGVNAAYFTPGDPIAIAEAVNNWVSNLHRIDSVEFGSVTANALKNWNATAVANSILRAIFDRINSGDRY